LLSSDGDTDPNHWDEVGMPCEEIKEAHKEITKTLEEYDQSLPPPSRIGGVSKPMYARLMAKKETKDYPHFLKCVFAPLLVNELVLYPEARVGEVNYRNHFLNVKIKDEQLPWWGKTSES
jgi:hypothetical protein